MTPCTTFFEGLFFLRVRHAIACGHGCGNGGERSCGGVGREGDSAVQSHSMGGFRARAEGDTHTHTHTGTRTHTHTHTQRNTHTHTQEHTEEHTHTHRNKQERARESCTYPLATYPFLIKSARNTPPIKYRLRDLGHPDVHIVSLEVELSADPREQLLGLSSGSSTALQAPRRWPQSIARLSVQAALINI